MTEYILIIVQQAINMNVNFYNNNAQIIILTITLQLLTILH